MAANADPTRVTADE
ncbi:hypothetical protein NJB25_16795 [Escherichia fergusonii]|nr:hypothetical protein [Escherichia fergusonii]MCO7826637.1 hypothetical protein [Escherichia fergusonii]MCO7835835.1 hypothetical protein [Escherichia fergusonii]MCP9649356.1 hypothetical protein [Escherichia fergusonii]UPJ23355.1 hypothetical protein MYB88_09740 [Escherichia fergusonii]